MQLILGSTSPRRKEILEFFSIPFRVESPDFEEESVVFDHDPRDYVLKIARGKAMSLLTKFPNDAILTADTTVCFDGEVLGKPAHLDGARQMLRKLSGASHTVYSSVCVAARGELFEGVEQTRVFFHELTDNQIDQYIKSLHVLDKAGSYAIQKGGSIIVKRIEGCYYNIMGLPIDAAAAALQKAGIDLWRYLKPVC